MKTTFESFICGFIMICVSNVIAIGYTLFYKIWVSILILIVSDPGLKLQISKFGSLDHGYVFEKIIRSLGRSRRLWSRLHH